MQVPHTTFLTWQVLFVDDDILFSPYAPDLFATVPCHKVGAVVEAVHKQGWHTMHGRQLCDIYHQDYTCFGLPKPAVCTAPPPEQDAAVVVRPAAAAPLPQVSLMMLSCNRPAFVELAVQQVTRQAYPLDLLEVVVVDDGPEPLEASSLQRASGRVRVELLEAGLRQGDREPVAGSRAGTVASSPPCALFEVKPPCFPFGINWVSAVCETTCSELENRDVWDVCAPSPRRHHPGLPSSRSAFADVVAPAPSLQASLSHYSHAP